MCIRDSVYADPAGRESQDGAGAGNRHGADRKAHRKCGGAYREMCIRDRLEKMKELRLCETEVSLRGALNRTSEAQMDALVAELCAE